MVLRPREPTAEERSAIDQLAPARTAPARRGSSAPASSPPRARARGRAGHRRAAPARRRHRARLDPPLQCRRPGRAGGPPARGPAADLCARAGRDRDRRRADRAPGTGPARRVLDPRPAGGVPERARGDRDQAQPHRRDPARRGAAPAPPREPVRRPGRPRVRRKTGRIRGPLHTAPPESGVVIRPDGMGPESAKTFPGRAVVAGAQRAEREIDHGRRGRGSILGAFRPATGGAFTRPYPARSSTACCGRRSSTRSRAGSRPRPRPSGSRPWSTI